MNRSTIIAAFFALVFFGGQCALAQSGYNLFQKGLVQERVKGDLDEAIKVYERIIIKFPNNRPIVAKALLHIGLCYEKMGKQEAQKAYQRLIKEFADQLEPVAQARARLAALGPMADTQQTGIMTRELKIQYIRGLSLNRDGSKLLYTATKSARENVVVRDLVTGKETHITHYASGDERGMWPIFSPDESQVAYMDVDCNLHIVSLQTGEDRNLNHEGGPINWSGDGRFILLAWSPARGEVNFSVLSVDNATVKKLDLELPFSRYDCRFSPDAQYVTYSQHGNLYLYHIDSDDVIQITEGSAEDTQPRWCPDGKTILFLSRRAFGPERDLCILPVANGKVTGDVQVIIPDFGEEITLCSLNRTGRLLYEQGHLDEYVCSITVDPGTGEPLGEIVRMVGGMHPVWSPDGKQIAYVKDRALHVMSADGKNDQTIMKTGFHPSGTYAWAPDNDTIYMPEILEGNIKISAISVSNKERRIVWPGDGKTDTMHMTCSPDGKRLAFLKPASSSKEQLFTMGVDGTGLRQLTFDEDVYVWYPAWSPDGKQIAIESGRSGSIKSLMIISVEDGKAKDIFRGNTPGDRFYWKSWSPDGSKIVWIKDGLRIGEIATGKYRTFNMNVVQPMAPCWSPDGTKILFNTTEVSKVMLMDNFLPKSTAGE